MQSFDEQGNFVQLRQLFSVESPPAEFGDVTSKRKKVQGESNHYTRIISCRKNKLKGGHQGRPTNLVLN